MHQTEQMPVSAAAKHLGCSRWTVVRLIKSGDLPAQKLGGATSAWIIRRRDVERLAAKRSKDAAA